MPRHILSPLHQLACQVFLRHLNLLLCLSDDPTQLSQAVPQVVVFLVERHQLFTESPFVFLELLGEVLNHSVLDFKVSFDFFFLPKIMASLLKVFFLQLD